tara:strand:+ start:2873 stop:6781 length:3909 start_codon:yes stop_codon:yes gene_type:complete
MPFLTFEDGSQTFIPDEKPETIAKAKEAYRLSKKGDASVLGDIGLQTIRGLQKIGEGAATTITSGIDYFADTNLTQDVKRFYERTDVGEAKTTAGEVTRYLVQFGLPGFGAAGVLARTGKVNRFGQAVGAGVVDGAVATDDVVTLKDTFLDTESESDEARLARLNGAEAASERLKEKFEVALEGGAFVFGLPLAIKAVGKTVGAGVDLMSPVGSFIAKLGSSKTKPGEISQFAFEADSKQSKGILRDLFKEENFKFYGDSPDELVGQAKFAKTNMIRAVQDRVDSSFNSVENIIQKTVDTGSVNQSTALSLSRNIEDYLFPRVKIDYQQPNLTRGQKLQEAKRLQEEALNNIKNLEKKYINYESVGLNYNNGISETLKANKELFETYSKQILDISDESSTGFMNLFLPDDLRNTIAKNVGTYGTRAYKAYIDKGFKVDPNFQKTAIEELKLITGNENEARAIFNELLNPGPKNKVGTPYEVNEVLLEGLKIDKGILKGKTLDDLPAVRRALGETAGYLQGDWRTALKNTQITATTTAKRQASLVGKYKMFDEIKKLDELSPITGGAKFLKTEAEALKTGKQIDQNTIQIFNEAGESMILKKFTGDNAGSLDGMYASSKTYNALLGAASDIAAESNAINRAYASLLAVKAGSQYGKTVLSPGAQVRNFTSIPFFSLLNGNVGSTGRFADAVANSFAGILDPKKRVIRKDVIQELTEEGMIQGGGAQLGETLELAKLATDNLKWARGVAKISDTAPIKFLEKTYRMTDDTGRVFNYLNEKERFKIAISNSLDASVPIESAKNITRFANIIQASPRTGAVVKPKDIIENYGEEALERFIKSESAEITANTVQNYQRVVPIVSQIIRRLPIGNFVAFPSEIIRNTFNAYSRGVKELLSDNKQIQKIGMRRVVGATATTASIPTALLAIGSTLTGVDNEKVDAYKRSFAAPWDRTATLIPIASDKDGNPTQFFNFSYMNPYDYLKRPGVRLIQEIENGNRDEESLMKISRDSFLGSLQEMFQSFAEPAFSAQAVIEAANGETSTGRKVWGESDTAGDKMAKGFYHVIDTILPTATPFNLEFDRTSKLPLGIGVETLQMKGFPRAVIGSTGGKGEDKKILNRSGKEIDVAETLVQAFSGIKVVKPQLDLTLRYRGFEANDAIRDSTNEFNRILRTTDALSADQILQGFLNQNESRFNVLRDLYTAIDDARTLGLSNSQIEEQLKIAKVANYKEVMRGRFKPIEPSFDLIQAARAGAFGTPQPVDTSTITVAQRNLRQDLEGRFITPDARRRALQVLREEEERKLTGSP